MYKKKIKYHKATSINCDFYYLLSWIGLTKSFVNVINQSEMLFKIIPA